ncbi:hypothetical protein [Chitinophaga eiseniae]|uniref:Outer membrane protein beta-barrel domain-containing protein n=1 Tax=Chitinophaga eiseniae TaxID=634771 RepID=A0A847SIJ3_9BACT|nr:hypothetical protein [Chitinophaga eiseniae]NLR79563.1 hypothetical protein [Chitinophaga eiseniae]
MLAIVCLTGSRLFSQNLMHAVGLSGFIDHTPRFGSIFSIAITYSPRFNLMEHKHTSLSVGIPLSIGGSGGRGGRQTDSYYVGDDIYYYDYDTGEPEVKSRFMIDVPVILNFNVGALSSPDNPRRVGFFVGGGFGYHYGPVNVKQVIRNYHYTDSTYQDSFGPVANAGIRIRIGDKADGIELKGSYMKSVSKRQPDIYGITLLYNFDVSQRRRVSRNVR